MKPRWPKSLDHHGQPWHLPFKRRRRRRRSKEVEKNLRSRICVVVVDGSWEKLLFSLRVMGFSVSLGHGM